MKSKLALIAMLLAVLLGAVSQSGCLAVAAGAAGGVVGHEIAEHNDDDDDDE